MVLDLMFNQSELVYYTKANVCFDICEILVGWIQGMSLLPILLLELRLSAAICALSRGSVSPRKNLGSRMFHITMSGTPENSVTTPIKNTAPTPTTDPPDP